MAISWVSGGSGSTTGTATATSIGVTYSSTGGNFLGVLVGFNNATSIVNTVVDSNAVSWTKACSIRTGSDGAELWYIVNSAAITSLTVSVSALARIVGIVQEYSGVGSVGQNNTASTTATTSSVAITLATGGNWIVGGFMVPGNHTFTANTGNMRAPTSVVTGSLSGTFGIANFLDNTNASAVSTAMTINNGANANFSACALELIPSGAVTTPHLLALMGYGI